MFYTNGKNSNFEVMRNLKILLFSFVVFTLSATSQVITEEEMQDLLNSQEIQIENPIISNFLTIRQISDENRVFSIQNNPGGAPNSVLVNQEGRGNNGYINQNGSGNETRLWQYNASNEASLWSDGNNITTSVKQDGEKNIVNSYIKNLDLQSRSALLMQVGNNNRIDLALFGDGIPSGVLSQEAKISQYGNNHVVEAFMEDTFVPIEVTQKSGAGGEGMPISVSNSYFNFPMK